MVKPTMTDMEFRAFLDLLMVSDPWPTHLAPSNYDLIVQHLTKQAQSRGFETWIDAYHNHMRSDPGSTLGGC